MVERIKCGDTEHCEHCANNGSVGAGDIAYLQRNELGRCDYYDGPDSRKRKAPTHQQETAAPHH